MLVAHVERGVKAGLVAGFAFGLLMALVANPLVGFADELGHDHGHNGGGDHHGAAVDGHHDGVTGANDGHVATPVTRAVSVVSGVLWGVLLGVVFSVAYYLLEPAIPGSEATKAYLLAGAGFVTTSGAPWLVLPPQPPGVEQALPTDTRLFLYVGMMVAGAVVCLLAGFAYRRTRRRRSRSTAAAVGLSPFCLLAVPVVLAPANPVTSSLSSGLEAGLTGVIVFGQVLLWAVLARAYARRRDDRHRVDDPGPGAITRPADGR